MWNLLALLLVHTCMHVCVCACMCSCTFMDINITNNSLYTSNSAQVVRVLFTTENLKFFMLIFVVLTEIKRKKQLFYIDFTDFGVLFAWSLWVLTFKNVIHYTGLSILWLWKYTKIKYIENEFFMEILSDPFEVIFRQFLSHLWQCLNHNLPSGEFQVLRS